VLGPAFGAPPSKILSSVTKSIRFTPKIAVAGTSWSDWGFDQMTDHAYLACQVGIICGLLFLVAVTAVSQHPQWFG
jgi:hypothetical protein